MIRQYRTLHKPVLCLPSIDPKEVDCILSCFIPRDGREINTFKIDVNYYSSLSRINIQIRDDDDMEICLERKGSQEEALRVLAWLNKLAYFDPWALLAHFTCLGWVRY